MRDFENIQLSNGPLHFSNLALGKGPLVLLLDWVVSHNANKEPTG